MIIIPALGVVILGMLVPFALGLGLWVGLLFFYGYGILVVRGLGPQEHRPVKRASMYGIGLIASGIASCLALVVLIFTAFGDYPEILLLGIFPIAGSDTAELGLYGSAILGGSTILVTAFVGDRLFSTKGSLRSITEMMIALELLKEINKAEP